MSYPGKQTFSRITKEISPQYFSAMDYLLCPSSKIFLGSNATESFGRHCGVSYSTPNWKLISFSCWPRDPIYRVFNYRVIYISYRVITCP